MASRARLIRALMREEGLTRRRAELVCAVAASVRAARAGDPGLAREEAMRDAVARYSAVKGARVPAALAALIDRALQDLD